ncbi:hypothetical protein [Saccharomonospora halophila]|nr:hypothetical protein [Saccharomonospora halophila]
MLLAQEASELGSLALRIAAIAVVASALIVLIITVRNNRRK